MKKIAHQLLLALALLSLCDQSNAMKRKQADSASEASESKKSREQSPLPDELFSDASRQQDDVHQTETSLASETSTEEDQSSQPLPMTLDTIANEMRHQYEDSHPTRALKYDDSLNNQVITAVKNNDAAALEELLLNDANPDAEHEGVSALMLAIQNQNPEIVEMLIKVGADVNNSITAIASPLGEMTTPLMKAAVHENIEILQLLIDAHAHINLQDRDGRTALIYAVGNNNVATAQALINRHANVDIPDRNGNAALMYAIVNKNIDLIQALIVAGANVNLANNKGNTPLILATTAGNIEILKILLAARADVTAANNEGLLAINCAQGDNAVAIRAILAAKHQEIRDAAADEWFDCPLDLINGPINDFLFGEQQDKNGN